MSRLILNVLILGSVIFFAQNCSNPGKMAYNQAIKNNSITELNTYLNDYPKGAHVAQAEDKLEDLMYQDAKTIFDYEKYLQRFPSGKYSNEPAIQDAKKILEEVNHILTNQEMTDIQAKVMMTPPEPVNPGEKAIIETPYGKMVAELYTDKAPNHAANFKRLAKAGYFNGTTFHRIIPGFVIQGGDINSRDADKSNDGMGGPGYTVDAEFNDIKHVAGILSMARAQDPNSAGSQFFVCAGTIPHLDRKYTVFGNVVEGLDVIEKIVNQPRDSHDNPKEPIRMYVHMQE